MKLLRSLFLVLAVATTAQADVWKKATEPAPQLDLYEALMSAGDEATLTANTRNINLATTMKTVDLALEKYRAAAKARPKSAEPYFRMASVLNSFFLDCSDPLKQKSLPLTCIHSTRETLDRRGREAVAAWDNFEAMAPLDPRVNEILLARAVVRTKLVETTPKPDALLLDAAKDYEALLDREDGLYATNSELVLGNLAETYMMLGDLDKAIELYKDAIRGGGGTSTIYGLAVALDRDERSDVALKLIKAQGAEALIEFQRKVRLKLVFFVPAGEESYYFGLAFEAFGQLNEAIDHWRAFIRSGAHPKYQPRAKDHLDKLLALKKLNWKTPIVPDFEEFMTPRRPRKP